MTPSYYFWDPLQHAKAFLRVELLLQQQVSAIERLEETVGCCQKFRSTRGVKSQAQQRTEHWHGIGPSICELTLHLSGLVLRTAGASSGRGEGTRQCTGPRG